MATHKVIQIDSSGIQSEYTGSTISTGVSSSFEFIAADATGKLDVTFLPNGVGADAVSAIAGEALSAGDFVYFTAGGSVMKADATAIAKKAAGYVVASFLVGATSIVFFDESNAFVTGLTPGVTYFLSTTPGAITSTPPTTTGNIVQEIGYATSATNIHVNMQTPVIRT